MKTRHLAIVAGVSDAGPYPVAEVFYSENRANDVTLFADVTLTYAFE
jgi:hypothetical protein